VDQLALVTDVEDAPVFAHLSGSQRLQPGRQQRAVIPVELHRR